MLSFSLNSMGQGNVKLYNPAARAEADITERVRKAREQGKHVLIQVGYNGCIWCYRFKDFVTKDKAIDSILTANYIIYHLNSSPENLNSKLLTKYRFPQRFGYPVFVILDGKGQQLHTQNSVYLEEGNSYNKTRVLEFLDQWTPSALDPKKYKQD